MVDVSTRGTPNKKATVAGDATSHWLELWKTTVLEVGES